MSANNSKPSRGLGRGFDSLIPQNFDSSLLLKQDERIQKLLIQDVMPNTEQPRTHFEDSALHELALSIKTHGILQPIVVTPLEGGKYQIVAGERRWRAAQLAKIQAVPAIVRSLQELERLEIALVENVQRVDLSPMEQAISIHKLHEQFSIAIDDIAKRLGKATTTVHNIVRLLQLPSAAQEALRANSITEGHARAILALKDDPKKQLELLELIQNNNWSVRQAEQFATAIKRSGSKSTKQAKQKTETATPETQKISKAIEAPVSIRRTAKGGKLEITFSSDKDLQRLVRLLTKIISKK